MMVATTPTREQQCDGCGGLALAHHPTPPQNPTLTGESPPSGMKKDAGLDCIQTSISRVEMRGIYPTLLCGAS